MEFTQTKLGSLKITMQFEKPDYHVQTRRVKSVVIGFLNSWFSNEPPGMRHYLKPGVSSQIVSVFNGSICNNLTDGILAMQDLTHELAKTRVTITDEKVNFSKWVDNARVTFELEIRAIVKTCRSEFSLKGVKFQAVLENQKEDWKIAQASLLIPSSALDLKKELIFN